eukprot:13442610-Alexandrium_andersonii.AAC.1
MGDLRTPKEPSPTTGVRARTTLAHLHNHAHSPVESTHTLVGIHQSSPVASKRMQYEVVGKKPGHHITHVHELHSGAHEEREKHHGPGIPLGDPY